jgi:AraC-like DNA-binding protein
MGRTMSDRITDYFRYLPVSPRDQQWGLYVTVAGCERLPPGHSYPSAGHPPSHDFTWTRGRVLQEYQLIYVTAGEGEFQSKATGQLALPAGSVLLLFPGVWHRYRPLREVGWTVYWVGFQGEDAQRMHERKFIRPEEPLLRTGLDDAILHPFLLLLDRVRLQPVGFHQMIAANTLEVLSAALSAVRTRQTDRRVDTLVHQAKLLLEEQTEEPPIIEDVAALLGLSRGHLFRVFKEYTGLSPYQYHLQTKLLRAKEMLHGSEQSIKQIAGKLKFQSVYHFSKLFRNKTGMSPSQWRAAGQHEMRRQDAGENARPEKKPRRIREKK